MNRQPFNRLAESIARRTNVIEIKESENITIEDDMSQEEEADEESIPSEEDERVKTSSV